MHKYRKIIGVITARANGVYQTKFIEGVQRRAYALNYDVLVFTNITDEGPAEKWQYGEHNIYNMINYDLLDAIILLPDTIKDSSVVAALEKKIRTVFHKPVVSAELDAEGFESIFTDDIQPVKKIVSHLIEEHRFTDIVFVTGKKGHPHAKNRLEGYFEAMVEHGLPIDRDKVYYGNFWYDCGDSIVDEILADGKQLPQAIACASDAMAVGVCEALKKRGIKVPEDVAVTGYDSVHSGITYKPCITSAVIPSDITGERAVSHLHALMTGEKYKEANNICVDICVGQSCGCNVSLSELENAATQEWRNEDLDVDCTAPQNNMLEGLLSESDISKYFWTVNWFTYQLGSFESFYIALCDNWDNLGEGEKGGNYLRDGYSQKMLLVLEHGNTKEQEHIDLTHKFNLAEMLPNIYNKRDYPTTYFFVPLHFNDRCFGYAAISFGQEIRSYDNNYCLWIRYVNSSMESLRRQRRLMTMYRRMRESAVMDTMTGIYNRNGFNLYADEIFTSAKDNGKNLLVVLGDLNRLKYINDNFGHLSGDTAIKAAAAAFKEVCGGSRVCCRIGGDEFIILDYGEYTREEIDGIKNDIRKKLSDFEQNSEDKLPMSVSLGVFYGSVDNYTSIEKPISLADKEMFEEKQRIKKELGITSLR
ncbi:MAG: GGDEF domain-containing protein [Oscillospiraceae bacterium]